jgi:hypothetical protein
MSKTGNNLDLFLVMGLGAGLYSFFKGFRVYREFRVVEDTPEIPIRSIPMGLVHIHGTASGEQSVASPVTRTPCFFYKVDIEKWETHEKSSGWSHYRTDADGVKFYLQDATGKVLVDAHQAEYDLVKGGVREIGGPGGLSRQGGSAGAAGSLATESELRAYISQVTAKKITSFVARKLAAAGPQNDPEREHQRQAAMALFKNPFAGGEVFAQMVAAQAPSLGRKLQAMGPQTNPEHEQARLEAVEALKHPFGSPEFVEHVRRVLETQHNPEQAQKFLAVMESMQHGGPSMLANAGAAVSGRFRLTEYCILPGQSYDLTGTCVENPQPKDEHDRNLIVKGQNEPTFLISCRTEKQVESTLRRRAVLSIFGGAAASIVCLAILLYRLGWL